LDVMHALKARVRNGRLVLDEPTDLPEGVEVRVIVVDEGDELDDAERARLDAALDDAIEQADAGRTVDADEALARLRARP
jgi:ribosomal protein L1